MFLQGYSSDNVLKINVISIIVFPTLNYKTKCEAYLLLEAYRWNLESWSINTQSVFYIYFLILIFVINTSPVMLPSSMLYLTGMLF